MDYGTDTKFIFCPRCGAIMEPPVCRVCGFDLNAPEEPVYDESQGYDGQGYEGQGNFDGQGNYEAQGNMNPQGFDTQGEYSQGPPPGFDPNAQQPMQQNMQQMQQPVPGYIPQQVPNGANYNPNRGQAPKSPSGYYPNPDKQPGPKFEPAEKKKKKWWVPLVIACGVLIVLFIICVGLIPTLGVLAPQLIKQKQKQKQQASIPSYSFGSSSTPSSEELPEEVTKRHFGRFDHEGVDISFYEKMADIAVVTKSGCFDPYINGNKGTYRDQTSVFDVTHKNWKPDDFTPPYYEPFADCIDEETYSAQYQISREYYYFDDKMGDQRIVGSIAYPHLEGNIPNLDDLNQEIFDRCASDLLNFMNGTSQYNMYVFSTCTLSVDSYITYNDGRKMSILLDCVVHTDDYAINLDSYIYAINVDLEKGKIIENDEIINVDADLAKKFREQCLTQNGRNESYDPLTDEQLADFLADKETNIVFFTPLGLEIGTHFLQYDDILSRGWSTITLNPGVYEQYLKDPSLAKTGTPAKDPNLPKNYKGQWTKVDRVLGREEEKKIKEDYPNYDWDNKEAVGDGSEEDPDGDGVVEENPDGDGDEDADDDDSGDDDSDDDDSDDDSDDDGRDDGSGKEIVDDDGTGTTGGGNKGGN